MTPGFFRTSMSPSPFRVAALLASLATSVLPQASLAQPSAVSSLTPPANGPRRADSTWFAIADCTVHAAPGATPLRATVVVRDGRIQAILPAQVGPDGKPGTDDDLPARVPVGPAIIDAQGLHLYPAFIEPYCKVETPAPVLAASQVHWNANVTPSRSALEGPGLSDQRAQQLRELGFGAAAIAPDGGIIAGQAAVVSLAKPSGDASVSKPPVYAEEVYQRIALETSRGGYPDSLMGTIALVRQTLSDADWLSNLPDGAASNDRELNEESVRELAKDGDGKPRLFVFDANNELNVLRAAKIAKEFDRRFIIMGSGMEFARLAAIQATGASFILPLNYPKAPDVSSPEKADDVELRTMMAWEQAPTNPRRLAAAGISFALTTNRLRDVGDLTKHTREAIRHGLSPEAAFAALTTVPADMLGVQTQLGTITEGKRANMQLLTGPLFDLASKETKLRTLYVDGVSHIISEAGIPIDGTWDVSVLAKDNKPTLARLRIEEKKVTLTFGAEEQDAPEKPNQEKPNPEKPNPEKPEAAPADEKAAAPKPIVLTARKVEKAGRQLSFIIDAEAFEKALANEAMPKDAPPSDTPAQAALFSFTFDASPQPQGCTGQVWLPADRELALQGTRSIRSLEGVWPLSQLSGNVPGLERAVLRITRAGEAQLLTPFEAPIITTLTATWSDNELSLTLPDSLGTLTLSPRWGDEPLAAAAQLESAGRTHNAVISKRPTNAFAGKWRVTSMDGVAIAVDATEQVFVTIDASLKEDGVVVTRIVPQPAEAAKPAGKATTKTHTAKSTKATSKDGTLTFSHTLKDLGFESQLVSSDSLQLRFASAAPSSLSLSASLRSDAARKLDRIEGVSSLVDPANADAPPTKHVFTLERADDDDNAAATKAPKDIPESLGLPFGPYALAQPAQARFTLLVNGTLWTNTAPADKPEQNDIIPAATLVLREGKIERIIKHEPGTAFADALTLARTQTGAGDDALIIDCTGMHITPGLIDGHSHTGISQGVNEGGQAVTAEVRIADVTNPDDVNWYRQLAGGITSVLNLHGSANAIGGQSQVNKLRWGCEQPDDMHFAEAIPGIKFALGENPRQVNWDRSSDRYPRTRMGVETLIRDRFVAAREYAAARAKDPQGTRRDIELDALVEILAGKRLIHCHSYRQDEIVMLTHVAREFGFKIGTFQHILEGYKVADYVRDYSGGASGFTDWWAFKQEVQDAIPAGLPLIQKVGATTSFNSDSNNLARFMNVEAAKAVRYGREVGGFTEAQALRFVTLHPAMQLRIDDRVGKLQPGMDADVVVWTRSPLSTFSLVHATFVDGKLLFSQATDTAARAAIASERDRLIAKLLEDPEAKKAREKRDAANDKPAADKPAAGKKPTDDDDDVNSLADLGLSSEQAAHLRQLYLDALTSGRPPTDAPGLCGCGLPHAAWVMQK